MPRTIISAQHLSKTYRVWKSPQHRLRALLTERRSEEPHPVDHDHRQLVKKRSYREVHALSDVSFEVHEGETVGVIGRNGSGKSTLLQILAGVIQKTSGEFMVAGRAAALLELGSGFNQEFTGEENVRLNAAVLGLSPAEVDAKFGQIIDFADIGEFLDQPVKTYSSGMGMRLAFAVAIHVDAKLLIVDEALSVGDERFQAKCFRKIEEIKENGTSILFVGHSIGAINQICDRALLLDQGRQVFFGPAKEATDIYSRVLGGVEAFQALAFHNREKAGINYAQPESTGGKSVAIDTAEEANAGKGIEFPEDKGGPLGAIIEVGIVNEEPLGFYARSGEMVTFYSVVRFTEDVEHVITGMMIRTPTGVDCYHTNSMCRDAVIPHGKKGQTLLSTYRMPLLLGPGSYLVTFDCQSFATGASQLVDIKNEAVQFYVMPSKGVEDGGISALGAAIDHKFINS